MKNTKRIKELRKIAHESYIREYDNDGRELIRMQVRNDDDFLSKYSPKDQILISNDVVEYLDNAVKSKRLDKDLHIIISSNVIDEKEKTQYQKGIRNYYRLRILDIERRLKTNTFLSILMISFAILIFSIYIFMEISNTGYIILQLIDIAGWVFVWEAVDLFFLERKRLKYEQLRDCSLYDAIITYDDIDN